MNARLFNDNGCETPNDAGRLWLNDIHETFRVMVQEALEHNVSLRDLQTLVVEEISVVCAEERLRKGLKERAEQRKAKALQS
jgi:hypothetical protein